MSQIEVIGGNSLHGEINVHGSKNAILPILAATLLNRGTSVIENCPHILDVVHMVQILESIGCNVTIDGSKIIVDSTNVHSVEVSDEAVRRMRSSIILVGSLLGREKSISISFPGGCSIGARPIDLHLKALKKLNVEITEEEGLLHCSTTGVIGNDIVLDFPSVGATENIVLASVISKGTTRIIGAAKEPEILEMCNFINSMGGRIQGAGTDIIRIDGVAQLHDTEYRLASDRIVAGTYMAAVVGTEGEITLKGVNCKDLYAVMTCITEMGARVYCGEDYITIHKKGKPKPIDVIRTSPYPGFPTDMQTQIMTILTIASGTSIIIENIFEARYKNVGELVKMGADIVVEGKMAVIKGVKSLHGTEVYASDLRGGAALVLAGLIGDGRTIVNNTFYIVRGYEDIVRDLKALGGQIYYND